MIQLQLSDESVILKQRCMQLAADDLRLLFTIVGALSYPGYRICMCKLKKKSYLQCANKYGISKAHAQWYFKKCVDKGYDIQLKRLFGIP